MPATAAAAAALPPLQAEKKLAVLQREVAAPAAVDAADLDDASNALLDTDHTFTV